MPVGLATKAKCFVTIFFLSGVAGLAYQVVWAKSFAASIGHEYPAMLAVVSAFMCGMAAGNLILVRFRRLGPRSYGWLELMIGVWAVLVTMSTPWIEAVTHEILGLAPSPVKHWMVVFSVVFVSLFPATSAMGATLAAAERFLGSWLQANGVEDRRRINQVANLADVGWHENSVAGKESPAKYVPRLRQALKIDDDRWGRMCAEHALPLGWESMDYATFLAERRPRMAEVIRIAFRKLGAESDAAPLNPPWFLPGAEAVWKQIGEAERALRAIVREVYVTQFGTEARDKIEGSLGDREREALGRAMRTLPAGSDPMRIVDYLYLGQLPALLLKKDVWAVAQTKLNGGPGIKEKLQSVIEQIAPVRNEIAHVREVSPERLLRANVACMDIFRIAGAASA